MGAECKHYLSRIGRRFRIHFTPRKLCAHIPLGAISTCPFSCVFVFSLYLGLTCWGRRPSDCRVNLGLLRSSSFHINPKTHHMIAGTATESIIVASLSVYTVLVVYTVIRKAWR